MAGNLFPAQAEGWGRRLVERAIALLIFSMTGLLFLFAMHLHHVITREPEVVTRYTPYLVYEVRPVALFVGDSYTAGTGVDRVSNRWTSIVADHMNWSEVNRGRGGTGYVSTSGRQGCGLEYCPNYLETIKKSTSVEPDVIVIAGGQNDFDEYQDNAIVVEKSINETWSHAARLFPDARLIAVGPSTTGQIDAVVTELDVAVQRAAKSVEATYVNLLRPDVIEDNMIAEDGVHVGPQGHAAIAERVIDTIGR